MAGYYHYSSPHHKTSSTSGHYSSTSRVPHIYTHGLTATAEESMVVPQSWFISNITVHSSRLLGKGSYGLVCLGEWLGVPVAVRKLHESLFTLSKCEEEKTRTLKAFVSEVGTLFQLNHPNIVSFYGIHDSSVQGELSLISDSYLVQELLCVSLNARNRQKPRLSYRNVLDLSIGITGGLRYLHERSSPITHQDLTSKNILLSLAGIPKISDLGIAKILNSTNESFARHSRRPGTELYMPPEVKMADREDRKTYDYRVDIYSLGVIVLEMSIGRDPVASEAFRICENEGFQIVPEIERRQNDLEEVLNSPLYNIVLACLTNIDDRPDAINVYEKLTELMEEPAYTSLPDTAIMPHNKSPDHSAELQEKIQLLAKEKDILPKSNVTSSLLSSPSSSPSRSPSQSAQDMIDRLEATIRSRDNEIASLRERNIQLEEELGKEQRKGLTKAAPSVKLSARGESLSKGDDDDLLTELKSTKKQLERYKDLTVKLDETLKETKLELAKYAHRQTSYDIHGQYETNALRSENRVLRSEVERMKRETVHYQQQMANYGRHYNLHHSSPLHYYK